MEIFVSDEIERLVPPLKHDEFAALEESCLEHGILSPLIIWREKRILIDGHHRYKIARQHKLKFQVVELTFNDERAAHLWALRSATDRRNLNESQLWLIRGKQARLVELIKLSLAGPDSSEDAETLTELAEQHKVSPATISRDKQFAKEVSGLTPELRNMIERGEVGTSRGDVTRVAAMPVEQQQEIVEIITSGQATTLAECLDPPVSHIPSQEDRLAGIEREVTPKMADPEERMKSFNRAIDSICKELLGVANRLPVSPHMDERIDIFTDMIKSACATLRQAKGAGLCPICTGNRCDRCKKAGWVTKQDMEMIG